MVGHCFVKSGDIVKLTVVTLLQVFKFVLVLHHLQSTVTP